MIGFPADYPVPAGSVDLSGVRLTIPGTFGGLNPQPRTDYLGNVTFTINIPLDVAPGPQTLSVDHFAGGGVKTAEVTILRASVDFSPAGSSPNEKVTIQGTAFNPASRPGGLGPLGVHQITGQGTSYIMVNGGPLNPPYVTYPVNLDSDGTLSATIVLPPEHVTFPGGTLEVTVVDDAGRLGIGIWNIRERKITVTPTESGRGSQLVLTGSGFLASVLPANQCVLVDLFYGTTKIQQVQPDSLGKINAVINVPISTAIPSTNTVTATISGCSAAPSATTQHKVPVRGVKITPQSAPTGHQVTVTGVSFVGYTAVTSMTMGNIPVLPTANALVNYDGSFSIKIVVPKLAAGNRAVVVTTADTGATKYTLNFVVLEALSTPTPSPTPSALTATATPAPTATPTPAPTLYPTPTPTTAPAATPAPTATPVPTVAEAIATLGNNLLRIWRQDESTGLWRFYDPRPAFAQTSTLPRLVSGDLYWIKMNGCRTVTLNNRQRSLSDGWNIIHW